MPRTLIEDRHELALTISFITKRRAFGYAYAGIQPDYFFSMPQDSGVYVCPVVPTEILTSEIRYPGDIDLLIVPYEMDELVLDRVVAVEIKAVRASFANQGKSPNGFGVSQASGLLQMGFPYVALAHLIVSDQSPVEAWRYIGVAEVLDRTGRAKMLPDMKIDWLPIDLQNRAFGRLTANCADERIGLITQYVGSTSAELTGDAGATTDWMPDFRRALPNDRPSRNLLKRIVEFFESRPNRFLDNPRFD